MIDDILGIPEHLRDAVWRVQTAGLKPFDDAPGVLICGVGGSAIGGDLASAALGDRRDKPIVTVRSYRLPPWAGPNWPVLCSSYSGETVETLNCMRQASAAGNPLIAATTGGTLAEIAREEGDQVIGLPSVFQPRAAVGYMFVVAAEAAALAGAGPRIQEEIEGAAAFLDDSKDELSELASDIVAKLERTIPVIHGCDLTAPVARRWKTQINENAKHPAGFSELPEAGHNELEGWTDTDAGLLSAVFLEDADQPDRERRRVELTADLLGNRRAKVVRITTRGDTRTDRMMWAVMLGDLVSVKLAECLGSDPEPVAFLDRIKSQL
jgi:glucose/mannose-6-phosphate isomerase